MLSGICNAARNNGQFAIVQIKLNIPGKVYYLNQDEIVCKVAFFYLLNYKFNKVQSGIKNAA